MGPWGQWGPRGDLTYFCLVWILLKCGDPLLVLTFREYKSEDYFGTKTNNNNVQIMMWHQAVNTLPKNLPIWKGRVSLDKNDNEFNHDKEKIIMKINLGLFSSLSSIWVHVVFIFNLNILELFSSSSYNNGRGLFAILQ